MNFNFWCPVEISKAVDENTGEELMVLGGIASTADEDSDGEFLDPKGFDIKPLLKSGLVNWHHQAKTCPSTIVGEPTKAEIRKDGLYIETKLYPSSQTARDIWELAKTLDSDSTTRRLGYSIEGKVLERKSNDKYSPDFKKITKAVITGVAITHQPKNPKTFANIIKGEIDDDLEEGEENDKNKEEKSMDTENARPLIRESVDKKLKNLEYDVVDEKKKEVKLTKSEIFDRVFSDIPGIDISKAKSIFNIIKHISTMDKKNYVTEEDILKAYDTLGLDTSDIEKAKKADDTEDTEQEDEIEKKDSKVESDEEEAERDAFAGSEEDDDDDDNKEEEKTEKGCGSKMKKSKDADILKAIDASNLKNEKYIKALGVMVKSSNQSLEKAIKSLNLANDKIDELNDIIKAQEETISELSSQLEEYGNGGAAPKSVRHAAPVSRIFKAKEDDITDDEEDEEDGDKVSVTNKAAVSDILDMATFNNGYDQEFSKACLDYEATGRLSPSIIQRLKNQFGITITK